MLDSSHFYLNIWYRNPSLTTEKEVFWIVKEPKSHQLLFREKTLPNPHSNISLITFLVGTQALNLEPEAHFLSKMVFIHRMWTLVFFFFFFTAKLFTKLSCWNSFLLMNKRVTEYVAGRNSQRAACNWQSFKKKFSVLMEAP